MVCLQDVGQSILESQARVLESLAFNIIAHIDDLMDDLTKHSDPISINRFLHLLVVEGLSPR